MTSSLLLILGDAMWILVLATIASSLRRLSSTLRPGVRLPMWWGSGRGPGWRARRAPAFALLVGVPLCVGLVLSGVARIPALTPQEQVVAFLLRAAVAPVHMLVHWGWIRSAMRTLQAEGALKP